jgi:hypothetical protein
VSSTKQEAVVRAEPAVPGGTVAENQGKPVAAEAGRRGDQRPDVHASRARARRPPLYSRGSYRG